MWLPDAVVLFYKRYIYQIKDRLILREERKKRENEESRKEEKEANGVS